MGNLVGNSRIYNIHAENEVAEILSHFSIEFIRAFIGDQLHNQGSHYNPVVPPVNIVSSLEQNFKQIIDAYPEEQQSIWDRRVLIYNEIIEQILNTYELQLSSTYETRSGWYSEAFILYDFFVGNFINHAIDFFSSIIISNADDIYKYLKLDEHKDATIYAKKIYSNNVKLGILINNIDLVIRTISGFDYSLDDILRITYTKEQYDLISMLVSDKGDFYRKFYLDLFASEMQTTLITEIRLAIHSKYVANNNISQTPINTTEVN